MDETGTQRLGCGRIPSVVWVAPNLAIPVAYGLLMLAPNTATLGLFLGSFSLAPLLAGFLDGRKRAFAWACGLPLLALSAVSALLLVVAMSTYWSGSAGVREAFVGAVVLALFSAGYALGALCLFASGGLVVRALRPMLPPSPATPPAG